MRHIHFTMELHKAVSSPKPVIAHLEEECTSDGAADYFSVRDISEAFNPMDYPIEGAAFDIKFTLPEDFDGTELTFERFREYGLEPSALAELCRKVSDGLTLDDIRDARDG